MFRILLFMALGYFIWRFVQVVTRSMSNSRRDAGDMFTNRPPRKPAEKFKDVQDADFEELPPEEKK